MMTGDIDLMLVNPRGRQQSYQELATELTAVEPPLWVRWIDGCLASIAREGMAKGCRRRRLLDEPRDCYSQMRELRRHISAKG